MGLMNTIRASAQMTGAKALLRTAPKKAAKLAEKGTADHPGCLSLILSYAERRDGKLYIPNTATCIGWYDAEKCIGWCDEKLYGEFLAYVETVRENEPTIDSFGDPEYCLDSDLD